MARDQLVDLNLGNTSKIINSPNPTSAQDVATKAYVDSAVEGLAWKDSVRVASVTNITLSGPGATIDGITMANNDRVLVKNQTTASQNGIYIYNGSGTAMTRALDASTFAELEQAVVSVEEGTSADSSYRQTEVNGTIDTNDIVWGSFGTSVPSASETVAGIAEIATQGETDTGTDDVRFVTPLKLATYSGGLKRFAANVGDGSATSFNLDHNFNSRDVTVEVIKNSGNYDTVIADVTRPSVNRVTVAFAAAPSSNAYRVIIKY